MNKINKNLLKPSTHHFFLLLARLVQFLHFFLQSKQISNALISAPVTLPRQSRKMQPNGTRWCSSKNGWIFLIGPIFYVCVSAKKNKVATPQKHGSRKIPWGEPEKKTFFQYKIVRNWLFRGTPFFFEIFQVKRFRHPGLPLPKGNSCYYPIEIPFM